MRKIYCCGPSGNVGWVAGWEFAEGDAARVTRVILTLNPNEAHTFGTSDGDEGSISSVLVFMWSRPSVYGDTTVFKPEERE